MTTKTIITFTPVEPVGIPIRDLPADVYAFIVGPPDATYLGVLVYRPAAHRSCQCVNRPGLLLGDESSWLVSPATEPTSVTYGLIGTGSVDVPAVEPDTTPMSDMTDSSYALIVASPETTEIGQWVFCDGPTIRVVGGAVWTIRKANRFVRILQPGDELTIKVVDESEPDTLCPTDCRHCNTPADEPPCADGCYDTAEHKHFEPKLQETLQVDDKVVAPANIPSDSHNVVIDSQTSAVPLDVKPAMNLAADQFERLADESRMGCVICYYDQQQTGCTHSDGICLTRDPRGYDGHAHPCWRPIEPTPTLDDALRCTAKEIVAAAEQAEDCGGDALWKICTAIVEARSPSWRPHLDGLDGLHHAIVDVHVGVADLRDTMRHYHKAEDSDPAHAVLAIVFVALRDRLGLFGEGNDDATGN